MEKAETSVQEPAERSRGRIIVISGPSGVGKTTLCQRLSLPGVYWSISATTRSPRPGEHDGLDYRFLTKGEFEREIEAGEFAEFAVVHENYYGTPRKPLDLSLENGRCILVDADTQGADALRRQYGDAVVTVFITAGEQDLAERLARRESEREEEVARRLAGAKAEMARMDDYDFVVVNDDLDRATETLRSLIQEVSERKQ